MTSTIEVVARAICTACGENPDHCGDAHGHDQRWQDYKNAALAAIAAMESGGVLVRSERIEGYGEDGLGGTRWPSVDILSAPANPEVEA